MKGVRREPDFFGGKELDLLFLARRLREALRVEDLLTESGIDYCVETGEYVGGFLFKRDLTGAYFYVDPCDLPRSQELLAGHRLKPYRAAHDG